MTAWTSRPEDICEVLVAGRQVGDQTNVLTRRRRLDQIKTAELARFGLRFVSSVRRHVEGRFRGRSRLVAPGSSWQRW